MPLTILVSGDREWSDYEKIKNELKKYPDASIIVGDCRGVDILTQKVAKELKQRCDVHKADWKKYGKTAGPIRNGKMLSVLLEREGDKLVMLFHPDLSRSRGTINMKRLAQAKKLRIIHVA